MAVLGPLVLRAPDPHEEPTGLTRRSRGGRRSPEYRREVDEPSSRAPRWLGPVALVAIVGFGAAVRAPGFTRHSLWFDDAWTALPARVGLSTAVKMVTTAPGYTLALRSWIRIDPLPSWWAQLPAFVAGLAGILAVFGLLRAFRVWPPLAYLGALVVAASPVAADYSTRVKQFGVDLLLACLLLWLLERWRRGAALRGAVELAIACAAAILVSAATLVVAAPVAAVAGLHAVTDRRRRAGGAIVAVVTGVTLVASYVLWLRHLSPSLHYGWTKRGYLLSTASAHRIAFSLEAMGTGILHWMLGVPLGRGRVSTAITPSGIAVALVAAIVLVALCVPPLVDVVRRRGVPGPLVAAAGSIVLAVALALLGRSPFGGGRTDEVLYPSILLLAATAVTPVVERAGAGSRRVASATAAACAAVLVAVGATHPAAYPTTDLRTLHAELAAQVRPTDVVVVDPWLTFTWSYDGLSPTAVSFAPTQLAWSQGFHVVSLSPGVVISTNYFFPDRSYSRLALRTHRIWYVAATVGHQSAIPGHPNHIEVTANYLYLRQIGWQRAGVYVTAPHTEAILLVYPPVGPTRAPRRSSASSTSRPVTAASS